MIPGDTDPFPEQKLKQIIHIPARCTVDDPRILRMTAHIIQHKPVFLRLMNHLEIQIRPVEPRHQHLRILQPENTADILLDLLRRSRRERTDHRTSPQFPDKLHDPHITRSKILPPL